MEPATEVLLLSWRTCLDWGKGYNLVEVFAGQGRVSKHWHSICNQPKTHLPCMDSITTYTRIDALELRHSLGHRVASIDADYTGPMDFNAVSGFLNLSCTMDGHAFKNTCSLYIHIIRYMVNQYTPPHLATEDLNSLSTPASAQGSPSMLSCAPPHGGCASLRRSAAVGRHLAVRQAAGH